MKTKVLISCAVTVVFGVQSYKCYIYELRRTRSDTNGPVQLQKKARSMKFWIKEEEELYYLECENKGADQLCSYRTAH